MNTNYYREDEEQETTATCYMCNRTIDLITDNWDSDASDPHTGVEAGHYHIDCPQ